MSEAVVDHIVAVLPPLLPRKSKPSPWYVARIVCLPATSKWVVMVAVPAVSVAVPRVVAVV